LLNRSLWYGIRNHGLRIASIEGGSLRNAIPRESFAVVTVPAEEKDTILAWVTKSESVYRQEYAGLEPDLKFVAELVDLPETVMDTESQKALVYGVYAAPNNVIRMSHDMEGLVETSTNLAVVKSHDGVVDVLCLLRSSVDTAMDDLKNMFVSVFEPLGAKINFEGDYPGWKPNMDSPILKTMQNVYNKKFGKIPEIKAIHAGLECGLLGGAYPNWDMISFGPTIRNPHSPDEKVNIGTVQKFWDYLVETLGNIPEK
jgi:dipeptidase D